MKISVELLVFCLKSVKVIKKIGDICFGYNRYLCSINLFGNKKNIFFGWDDFVVFFYFYNIWMKISVSEVI